MTRIVLTVLILCTAAACFGFAKLLMNHVEKRRRIRRQHERIAEILHASADDVFAAIRGLEHQVKHIPADRWLRRHDPKREA